MVIAPRPLARLLSDAMTSLAYIWRALLAPAVVISIAMSLAAWAIFEINGGGAFLDAVVNNPAGLQKLSDDVVAELSGPFYAAATQIALLQVAASVFIALASHRAVVARLKGSSLSGVEVSRQAARHYLVGLGATLLVVVVVVIVLGTGLLLWLTPILSVGMPNATSVLLATLLLCVLVGPGIWAAVALSMTTPAVAVENAGILRSIRRSMTLVRGRWWATLGFLVMVGLLGGVAIVLIQLVALPLASAGGGNALLTAAAALGVLTQGMLVAAIAAVYTHWYLDLRARKERLSTSDLG
jgi:hypothetical protein